VWSGQSGQDVPAVLAQAYALDREIGLKFPYLCYESSPSLTSEGAELDVVTLAVGHVDRWSQCFELDTFLELGRSETIFACRLVDGPAVIVCTDAALYYASKDSQGMWALALCPHTQLPSQVRVLLADVKVGAWDNSVAILAAVCVGVCDGKEMWSWVTWSARCSSVSATVGENPYGFPQSYAAVAACAHVIRPSATGAGASTGEDVFLATTTNRLLRFRWQTLVSTCVLPHTPAEVLAPPSQLGHSMLLVRFADVEGTLHVYHSCRQMSGYPEPVHVMSGVRHFFVSNFLGIEDGVPGGANDGVEGSPCKWLGFQLLALTAEFGLFMRKWDGVRGVRLTDFVRTYCGLDRDGRASALTRAVDTTTCQTLFSLAASFRARCEAGQTRCTQLERSLREKVQLYRHGLDLLGVVSTPRELFSQVDCLRRGLLPMLGKKAGARGGFTVSPTGLLDRDDTRVVSTAILSLDRLSLSYDAKLDMWSISLHITNTSRARLHRLSLSLLSAHGKVQSSSQYCHCLGPRKGAYLILRFQGKQLISKSVSSFKLLVTADAASVEKGESNDSVDYVCECVGMRCLCVLGSVDHACDSLDLRRELQVDLGDVSLPPRLLHSWRSSHVFLAKSEDHYAHHFQFRSQVRVSLKGPSSTDLAGSLGECVTDGRVDESEARYFLLRNWNRCHGQLMDLHSALNRVTVSRHPQLPSQCKLFGY
jgi:hypothetical protein